MTTPKPILQRAVAVILECIGEDPKRPGLRETPERVARAWLELTTGYREEPGDVLKTFEDGAEKVDEMITVGPIPFFSLCEHHMLPFWGSAWIGYVPNGKIVGLSKLARLLNVYARRLQVQERLTNQVADALVIHVQPRGVGVHLSARHLCMEMRGIERSGAVTKTTALRGAMLTKPEARAEFLEACR
jgi:GTP cyclohydrolase I